MLRKIISGGQTGADRTGLDFAIEKGLGHGGYVPRGRKAEDGRIDDRYNLIELSTSSYPARTRRNIEKSDGTVIFSLERVLNGGTKLTLKLVNMSTSSGSRCCTSMTPAKRNIEPASFPFRRAASRQANGRMEAMSCYWRFLLMNVLVRRLNSRESGLSTI